MVAGSPAKGDTQLNLVAMLERYFLKTRYIYAYTSPPTKHTADVDWCTPSDFLAWKPGLAVSTRLCRLLKARVNGDSWKVFFLIEGDTLKGYSFLHCPSRTEWNDCLPTAVGQARESSTFVELPFRRTGIRGQLLNAQRRYCSERSLSMWCVIEKANIASCRSTTQGHGVRIRRNYLLKLCGVNIASVVTPPLEVHFVLGHKGMHR